MAPYYNDRPVRQLARKTGVAAVTLYTQVGCAPEMATFFDLFETNLHALIAALSGTR